jgi:hypothetical protein
MSEKLVDQDPIDLSGLELVKEIDGDRIFAPPEPEPVVKAVQQRDTRVVEGQLAEPAAQKPRRVEVPTPRQPIPAPNDRVYLPKPPVKPPVTVVRQPVTPKPVERIVPGANKNFIPPARPTIEKARKSNGRARIIGAFVAVAAVGTAGVWAGYEVMKAPAKKAGVVRADAGASTVPKLQEGSGTINPPSAEPTETIDLSNLLATPEENTTNQPSATTAPSPLFPQVLAPSGKSTKPTAADTSKSASPQTSVATTPSPTVASPESTTSVVPPVATSPPTPISTEKIKPHELATHPSAGAVETLRSFVRDGDVNYFTAQYSNLKENLDLEQLAREGELDDLTVSGIRDHQRNLSAEYSNDAVAGTLGEPAWLSETRLRQMRSSGQSAADRLLEFTDNALDKSPLVYPITGKSIAKVPYLNKELSDALTEKLHTGVDPSVGDAEDTHLLAVKTAELKGDNTVALAAVIGTYHKNGETVNTFRWDLLEPTNNLGQFIGVTIFEKELNPVPAATVEPTPSTTSEEPEPTATETDTSYNQNEEGDRQKGKSHRHDNRHHSRG